MCSDYQVYLKIFTKVINHIRSKIIIIALRLLLPTFDILIRVIMQEIRKEPFDL